MISLSSSNPAVASVPATATVPANGFTGTFVIATSPVAATTTVTITATYNGVDAERRPLTVTPRRRAGRSTPAERHGQPVERDRRLDHLGRS